MALTLFCLWALLFAACSIVVPVLLMLAAVYRMWRDERDAARRCAALVARPDLREGAPHA